jgi:hypothetical protein
MELRELAKLISYYSEPLSAFKPSMFETIYNCNWNIEKKFALYDSLTLDNHPTPTMTLDYIKKIYPDSSFTPECHNYISKYETKICGEIVNERIFPIQPNDHIMSNKTIMKLHPLSYEK